MPHCTKCGTAVADNAAFCGNCGAPQANLSAPSPAPSAANTQPQMAENVAGCLSYALGWITGLIFYLIDKRPYVRFHAAQSIVVFGILTVIGIFLGRLYGFNSFDGGMGGMSAGHTVWHLFELVLWILLMVKAYQGERFRVPIAADVADSIIGKS